MSKVLPIYRMNRVIAYCTVDDDVFEWAKEFKWSVQTRGCGGPVQVTRYTKEDGKTKNIFLAREIMQEGNPAKQVYVRDNNPYNLVRDNLEVAGNRRRVQHRSVDRRLGVNQGPAIPQMGNIGSVVNMAARLEAYVRNRQND